MKPYRYVALYLALSLLVLPTLFTACSGTRHVVRADGGVERTTFAFGGKGTQAWGRQNPDGSIEFDIHEWDHEKSFRDAVIAAGAMYAAREAGRTTRNQDSEGARTSRHASEQDTARRVSDNRTTVDIERERTARILGGD